MNTNVVLSDIYYFGGSCLDVVEDLVVLVALLEHNHEGSGSLVRMRYADDAVFRHPPWGGRPPGFS